MRPLTAAIRVDLDPEYSVMVTEAARDPRAGLAGLVLLGKGPDTIDFVRLCFGLPESRAELATGWSTKTGLDAAFLERILVGLAGHVEPALREIEQQTAESKTKPKPEKAEAKGRAVDLSDPEPAAAAVDGDQLASALAALISRYVVLPEGGADVVALWIIHTYAMDIWEHTPYLAVVSPVKGCGKSTLLRLLLLLSRRALAADTVTPAALFRVIEACSPSLILDEIDGLDPLSDVWTILNSGHSRTGGALRNVGEDHEPRVFATYGAKALGYIRGAKSPVRDTVEDRAITITLQRKKPEEKRDKLRVRDVGVDCLPLRRQCMRWVKDNRDTLAFARPSVPEVLDDRGADCWEPLLSVADAVGGAWPAKGRALAVSMSGDRREDEAASIAGLLIEDLAELVDKGTLTPDRHGYAAETMISVLKDLPDRPWATWGRERKGITPHALAKQLKPYGLKSASKSGEARRYDRVAFDNVLGRFRTKRQSVILTETLPASDSSEGPMTHDASEASLGGYDASTNNNAATDPSVYTHRGIGYRLGDVLPDGRRVLDPVGPILSKRPAPANPPEAA